MKYFSILQPIKDNVRLEYVPSKNVWLWFIPMAWVDFFIKLRNFDFESHWDTLICFNKEKLADLNMSNTKMFDFVPFSSFGFTLVLPLKNFDFESHWSISIYFGKKRYGVRFKYVPWKNVCFCLFPLFGFTLVIKLRNSDFESHWNTLIFFYKKMMPHLIMWYQTFSDLV